MNVVLVFACLLGTLMLYGTNGEHPDCSSNQECRFGSFQNKVCRADWVILASMTKVNKRGTRYLVEVKEFFKPNNLPDWVVDTMGKLKIHTVKDNNVIKGCQVVMQEGKEYILSGTVLNSGQLYMDTCSSVNHQLTDEFNLTALLRENLNKNFQESCACEVKGVENEVNITTSPEVSNDRCLENWDSMPCTNQHLVCQRQDNVGGGVSKCEFSIVEKKDMTQVCRDLRGWSKGGFSTRG